MNRGSERNNDTMSAPNIWCCSADLGLPRVDTTVKQTVCKLDNNGLKIPILEKPRLVFELFLDHCAGWRSVVSMQQQLTPLRREQADSRGRSFPGAVNK